jgi:SOS-response transcriptional repressor LexA
MTYGEALKAWRKKVAHLTQDALARELGISRGHVAMVETDRGTMSSTLKGKLASMGFRYSPKPDDAERELSKPYAPASQLLIPIPYLGKITASDETDWVDPFTAETFEYVPPEMGDARGRFCYRIEGDSMFDLLWPGDLVVFQRDDVPRIGKVIAFRSFDNKATVKVLKHNGTQFILHPINPAYNEVEARGTCLGYLVGIVREHGTRRVTIFDSAGISP